MSSAAGQFSRDLINQLVNNSSDDFSRFRVMSSWKSNLHIFRNDVMK